MIPTLSTDPIRRLREIGRLSAAQRKRFSDGLVRTAPRRPWPYGMPCSAAPLLVILGVSPGGKVTGQKKDPTGKPFHAPPLGKRHSQWMESDDPHDVNLSYKNPTQYWSKTTDLCRSIVNRWANGKTMRDPLALCGQLNLGIRQSAVGNSEAVQPRYVKWVSRLLYEGFPPVRLIVLFGLNTIMKNRRIANAWEAGGLHVDWASPFGWKDFPTKTKRYHFRWWKAQRRDGTELTLIIWPNHPSKHPFGGGPDGAKWQQAKREGIKLLMSARVKA